MRRPRGQGLGASLFQSEVSRPTFFASQRPSLAVTQAQANAYQVSVHEPGGESMFPIGSKVVHPFYGAGTITTIQEKCIGESTHAYYIITTVSRPMQLMVPVDRADAINLRPVAPALELRSGLRVCSKAPSDSDISRDLRARQAAMREQLKSGCFDQIAHVARLLFFMNSRRPLGTVDRQLLDQGKDLLAGELALASEVAIAQAMQEVEGCLTAMFEEPLE